MFIIVHLLSSLIFATDIYWLIFFKSTNSLNLKNNQCLFYFASEQWRQALLLITLEGAPLTFPSEPLPCLVACFFVLPYEKYIYQFIVRNN